MKIPKMDHQSSWHFSKPQLGLLRTAGSVRPPSCPGTMGQMWIPGQHSPGPIRDI